MEWVIILAVICLNLFIGAFTWGVTLRVVAPDLMEDAAKYDNGMRGLIVCGTIGIVLWPITLAVLIAAASFRLAKPLAPKDE